MVLPGGMRFRGPLYIHIYSLHSRNPTRFFFRTFRNSVLRTNGADPSLKLEMFFLHDRFLKQKVWHKYCSHAGVLIEYVICIHRYLQVRTMDQVGLPGAKASSDYVVVSIPETLLSGTLEVFQGHFQTFPHRLASKGDGVSRGPKIQAGNISNVA